MERYNYADCRRRRQACGSYCHSLFGSSKPKITTLFLVSQTPSGSRENQSDYGRLPEVSRLCTVSSRFCKWMQKGIKRREENTKTQYFGWIQSFVPLCACKSGCGLEHTNPVFSLLVPVCVDGCRQLWNSGKKIRKRMCLPNLVEIQRSVRVKFARTHTHAHTVTVTKTHSKISEPSNSPRFALNYGELSWSKQRRPTCSLY